MDKEINRALVDFISENKQKKKKKKKKPDSWCCRHIKGCGKLMMGVGSVVFVVIVIQLLIVLWRHLFKG